MMDKKLSHINEAGEAVMVDVTGKSPTTRSATASGQVIFPNDVFETLAQQDFLSAKGSIVQTATIAAIQAVKKTWELIPLCHPLNLGKIQVNIRPEKNVFNITCTVKCTDRTGVEMEALTGVSIAALTIYDMCKALSHDIVITGVQLEEKTGGKSDFKR